MTQLGFSEMDTRRTVSPVLELGAYEALWDEEGTSFKTLSAKFAKEPGLLPSDLVPAPRAKEYADYVLQRFRAANLARYGVQLHGANEYPEKLRDAAHPVELLYYQGFWDLVYSRSVAVVGTRKPTQEGKARTRKLVRSLVQDDFTIVSGLAAGIDTEAHNAALEAGGRTIAVLGTPLSFTYPRDNAALQERIAREFLVVSQVPVKRWERQDHRINRFFFPERNITMSALTEASIIVEAGETSGTLVQARAALHQGRKLFILDSNFRKKGLTWPHRFAERGAIRVRDYDDIREHLSRNVSLRSTISLDRSTPTSNPTTNACSSVNTQHMPAFPLATPTASSSTSRNRWTGREGPNGGTKLLPFGLPQKRSAPPSMKPGSEAQPLSPFPHQRPKPTPDTMIACSRCYASFTPNRHSISVNSSCNHRTVKSRHTKDNDLVRLI